MLRLIRLPFFLTLLLAAPDVAAEPPAEPRLVTDILQQVSSEGSEAFPVVELGFGAGLLVVADDGVHGFEPWIVGEDGESRLLDDLCPGLCSSVPSHGTEAAVTPDGRLFFVADDGQTGRELWISEPTERGVYGEPRRVADLSPGANSTQIMELSAALDGVIFAGFPSTSIRGIEPWISDGTPEGTRLLADVAAREVGSGPRFFTALDDDTVLFAAHGSEVGREWFRSDGGADLEPVADLCPGHCNGVETGSVARAGDRILFRGQDEVGNFQVWSTDGESFVQLLERFPNELGVDVSELVEDRDREEVLFGIDREVFTSDGTPAGTSSLGRLPDSVSNPDQIAGLDESALVVSSPFDDAVDRLFALGRAGGAPPQLVGERSRLDHLRSLGDRAVLRSDDELWITDGRSFDVVPDLMLTGSVFRGFVDVGDRLAFGARGVAGGSRGQGGDELWITDGSDAGTSRLADLQKPRSDASPDALTAAGERLFFLAATSQDEKTGFGTTLRELWATSGAGAERLVPGRESTDLEAVGDRLFFEVYEPQTGREPWISDGTIAGTRSLGDLEPGPETSFAREPVRLGDEIYFFADSSGGEPGPSGQKLWVTDGTAEETRLVFDVDPQWQNQPFGCPVCSPPSPRIVLPRDLRVFGGDLVFVAGPSGGRVELWTSDGTGGGTRPLLADGPTFDVVGPDEHLTVVAEGDSARLFFTTPAASPARSLWITDGTSAGTVSIEDLLIPQIDDTAALGDLWVALAGGGIFEDFLLVSDGTPGGLEQIRVPISSDRQLVRPGDRLYFTAASDATGGELWSTDGTAEGTGLVADIHPGPASSGVGDLVSDGRHLYFTADDGLHGLEVWRTDGTGVERLTDFPPGPGTAAPGGLDILGSNLYFAAESPELGRELFTLPKDAAAGPACTTDATHHCLTGGRFRVGVRWRVAATGESGEGRVVRARGVGTDSTGFFFFFGENNLELAVKILDGTPLNGHYWLFVGALTDVEAWIDVVDTETGRARTWHLPPGELGSLADVTAFAD